MRALATLRAWPMAACLAAPGRWAAWLVQAEVAAWVPMAPRMARPIEVPTWREALKTPDAVPDRPGGTSRMATVATPGIHIPAPVPNSTKPVTAMMNGDDGVSVLKVRTPAAVTRQPPPAIAQAGRWRLRRPADRATTRNGMFMNSQDSPVRNAVHP